MQQVLFILLLIVVGYLATKSYGRIWKNIQLGKSSNEKRNLNTSIKNVVLIAFGQQKMFKRWIPAIFHLFIYVAFLFTQIELIEIILDGLSGSHRVFAPHLGGFYTLIINTIEVLSLLAFAATFVFLYRRNLLKVPRLVHSDLNGWPKLDGNLILIGEFLLIVGIFSMNSADHMLQSLRPDAYTDTGNLVLSSKLGALLFAGLDAPVLIGIERFGWWLHLCVVFGFILYLPYSKHFHIFLAFPNTYFAGQKPRGEMTNMEDIMVEVQSMMGLVEAPPAEEGGSLPSFGAKDIFDLEKSQILQAYTCTECGRCTDVCPANITGKRLSPRKIMMGVRDRADEVGKALQTAPNQKGNFDDGRSLFDHISREEIHACTTCNACVEACPVLINPMNIILEMRRYEILMESAGPPDWTPMFTSLENQGSVWQVPGERDSWKNEMTN